MSQSSFPSASPFPAPQMVVMTIVWSGGDGLNREDRTRKTSELPLVHLECHILCDEDDVAVVEPKVSADEVRGRETMMSDDQGIEDLLSLAVETKKMEVEE